jgi:hypothetical protein
MMIGSKNSNICSNLCAAEYIDLKAAEKLKSGLAIYSSEKAKWFRSLISWQEYYDR